MNRVADAVTEEFAIGVEVCLLPELFAESHCVEELLLVELLGGKQQSEEGTRYDHETHFI